MLQVKDTATRMLTNFSVQAGTNDFYTAQRVFKDPGVKALPQVCTHQAWPTYTCTPASMCVKASACLPCGQRGHSYCVCEQRRTAALARTCRLYELPAALLNRDAICCAALCVRVCVTGCGG